MEQLIEDSRKIMSNQDNLFEEQVGEDIGSPVTSHVMEPESEMKDLSELILSTIEDRMTEVHTVVTDCTACICYIGFIFINTTDINIHVYNT